MAIYKTEFHWNLLKFHRNLLEFTGLLVSFLAAHRFWASLSGRLWPAVRGGGGGEVGVGGGDVTV